MKIYQKIIVTIVLSVLALLLLFIPVFGVYHIWHPELHHALRIWSSWAVIFVTYYVAIFLFDTFLWSVWRKEPIDRNGGSDSFPFLP